MFYLKNVNQYLPCLAIMDAPFIMIQVNWLDMEVFYPDFWIYRTDFKGPAPPNLHTNFSAYYGQFNLYIAETGQFSRDALYH